MFLNRLSRSEGVAFLSLAHEIVTADSVTTVGEVTRLAAIRRELGISLDETPEMLRMDAAAARIDSASARMIVMIELVDLCHADRRLSVFESGVINRLMTMWRINEKTLQRLENWVGRHRQLMSEAHELIAKGS